MKKILVVLMMLIMIIATFAGCNGENHLEFVAEVQMLSIESPHESFVPVVITSTEELEEYLAAYGEVFWMDDGHGNDVYADEALRTRVFLWHDAEFFRNEALVVFAFVSTSGSHRYFIESIDGAGNITLALSSPTDGPAAADEGNHHAVIEISKSDLPESFNVNYEGVPGIAG